MSRRTILLALIAMLAFAWAATPAFAIQLSPTEPHSPNAETIHSTYWVVIAIVFALILVINAALIVAVLRFRERRGQEPARFHAGRGALRPAIGVLSLVALAIFIYGVVRTGDVRDVQPSGPDGLSAAQTAQVGVKGLPPTTTLEGEQSATSEEPSSGSEPTETAPLAIDAIAQQWLWRFEYPGGTPGHRTFAYGELVVPVDTTVLLNLTAIDVLNSWSVPALGGQVEAVPGKVTQTWFRADETGTYPGNSTVFSGTSFPAMRSWVRVVTVPEYQQYIEQLKKDLTESQAIVAKVQEGTAAP